MKKIVLVLALVLSLIGCQSKEDVVMIKCSHLIDAPQMYRLFEYSFNDGDTVDVFELKLVFEPKEGYDSKENRVNSMKNGYESAYKDVEGITYNSDVTENVLTVDVVFNLKNDTAADALRSSGLFTTGQFKSSTELIDDLYFRDECE